jgi:hypothetical protein
MNAILLGATTLHSDMGGTRGKDVRTAAPGLPLPTRRSAALRAWWPDALPRVPLPPARRARVVTLLDAVQVSHTLVDDVECILGVCEAARLRATPVPAETQREKLAAVENALRLVVAAVEKADPFVDGLHSIGRQARADADQVALRRRYVRSERPAHRESEPWPRVVLFALRAALLQARPSVTVEQMVAFLTLTGGPIGVRLTKRDRQRLRLPLSPPG